MISTEPDIQRLPAGMLRKEGCALQIRRRKQNKTKRGLQLSWKPALFLERLYKLYGMKEKGKIKERG
jgi:hypothetical protein